MREARLYVFPEMMNGLRQQVKISIENLLVNVSIRHFALALQEVYLFMYPIYRGCVHLSVAVLAEISPRSPQKIFIFIINIYFYRIKVSKK